MVYKFCPKCGSGLTEIFEENHRREKCNACGFIFYFNSSPCAAAIITDNNKILLGKRGAEPFKGWWDVPGGFLEQGEHPDDGVRREVKEELGIEINITGVLGVFMDFYEPTESYTLNIHYLATIKSGTPKAGSDLVDFKWFDKNDLPKDIAYKNGQEAVEAWRKLG